tara:strand:+ start:4588 stop:5160 length:573 start_codon:yes stop_codon:yes gene_type:complete
MINSFLNKDYLNFMTGIFKSDEEKEKERLDKIYTNPVTGEVEQYASGIMGMRPEVQAQMQRQIDAQQAKPIMGQIGPDGKPIGLLDAMMGVRPMDLTQGTAQSDPMATMRANIQDTYDLSTGQFKGKEAVKAVAEATKGMSPNTLMTLLSAFQTDKPKPPPVTKIPTATKGVLQDYEDPYEKYRRQGGMF